MAKPRRQGDRTVRYFGITEHGRFRLDYQPKGVFRDMGRQEREEALNEATDMAVRQASNLLRVERVMTEVTWVASPPDHS